jgi:hypothetical protein
MNLLAALNMTRGVLALHSDRLSLTAIGGKAGTYVTVHCNSYSHRSFSKLHPVAVNSCSTLSLLTREACW